MSECACTAAYRLEVYEWQCKEHGYNKIFPPNTELIKNGEHTFAFPPDPSKDGAPNTLGKCQSSCRMIVTKKEAIYRKMGPCQPK